MSVNEEQIQSHEEVVNAFYPDADAEPLEALTDEAETDETPTETDDDLADANETTEEVDEVQGSEEETTDTEDVQAIEIDGTEHNLTDIQEWKEAHDNVKSMQADCTKKWTEASVLKKDAEAQSEEAKGLVLELEVLVNEDKELNLESYKDIESDNYDPDKYIELKEKLDSRAAKLAELKAKQPSQQIVLTQDELAAESKDFYAYDATWIVDDKLTDAFQKDMKAAFDYLKAGGYSQDEVNAINHSHHWKTIIDASKFNAQKNKASSLKKRVLKTPKASKPTAKSSNLSAEEIFYGKK